jgi:hypothetical protein
MAKLLSENDLVKLFGRTWRNFCDL